MIFKKNGSIMNILSVNNLLACSLRYLLSVLILSMGFGQYAYSQALAARKFVKKAPVSLLTLVKQKFTKCSSIAKSGFAQGKIKAYAVTTQSYKQFLAGYAAGVMGYSFMGYKYDDKNISGENFSSFRNKFLLTSWVGYFGLRGFGGLFKKAQDEDNSSDDFQDDKSVDSEEDFDKKYLVHPLFKGAAFVAGFYAGYKSSQFGAKYKFPFVAPVAIPEPFAPVPVALPVVPIVVDGAIEHSYAMTREELDTKAKNLLSANSKKRKSIKWGGVGKNLFGDL